MFFPKIARVPTIFKWLYPSWYIWDLQPKEKTVYLTFDDGPVPEVTEFVLDTLSRKRDKPIQATFFCTGDNVRKHGDIFKRILKDGHAIGNHTFNHINGVKTPTKKYLQNIEQADVQMLNLMSDPTDGLSTHLYRPPYGLIRKKQAKLLRKLGYKIIMYRVVGYDWEARVSKEQCLRNITTSVKSGDIIVLHDSEKAFKNLKYALPKAIDYFENNGFAFGKLTV